ncbi:MAG TPA: hypothetical protein VF421_13395 [Niabella sp.]
MKVNLLSKVLVIKLILIISLSASGQVTYDRNQLQAYYQNQDYEQALAYLKSVPPTDDVSYLLDLGYANYVNGKLGAAKIFFTKLYGLDNSLQAPQLYLALLAEQGREFDTALFYYKNLTLLQPDRYKYWQAAAKELARLDSLDAALSYIRKAYALNPGAGSVVCDLAFYLGKQKQPEEAENIIDRFLATDTTYDPAIAQKIGLCFDAKRYAAAIRWGELYKKLEGGSSNPYVHLLYSYLNTCKPDSVISLYHWMELSNRMSESIAYGAALAYADKKEFAVSDSLLSTCIKFNIQEMAATYLRAKGSNAEAVKSYKAAIALYDTSYYIFHDPLDLFLAGRVYDLHLKDRTKAAGYYRKFLAVRPEPLNPDEIRIARYIQEFLNPKK